VGVAVSMLQSVCCSQCMLQSRAIECVAVGVAVGVLQSVCVAVCLALEPTLYAGRRQGLWSVLQWVLQLVRCSQCVLQSRAIECVAVCDAVGVLLSGCVAMYCSA